MLRKELGGGAWSGQGRRFQTSDSQGDGPRCGGYGVRVCKLRIQYFTFVEKISSVFIKQTAEIIPSLAGKENRKYSAFPLKGQIFRFSRWKQVSWGSGTHRPRAFQPFPKQSQGLRDAGPLTGGK